MGTLNDNESFSLKRINDNVNEETFVIGRKPREKQAYRIAMNLVEKFDNPKGLRFYYDVALKLSESDIWSKFERAHRKGIGRPDKYFTTLCLNDMPQRTNYASINTSI